MSSSQHRFLWIRFYVGAPGPRPPVVDLPMGPKERRSTALSPIEDAAIVALRVQALNLTITVRI